MKKLIAHSRTQVARAGATLSALAFVALAITAHVPADETCSSPGRARQSLEFRAAVLQT